MNTITANSQRVTCCVTLRKFYIILRDVWHAITCGKSKISLTYKMDSCVHLHFWVLQKISIRSKCRVKWYVIGTASHVTMLTKTVQLSNDCCVTKYVVIRSTIQENHATMIQCKYLTQYTMLVKATLVHRNSNEAYFDHL